MTLKIAMYWHNGRSLGHTAASAKIAHAVLAGVPDAHIGALTGAYRGLDLLPDAVDVIKLPSFANYDNATGAGLHSRIGVSPEALFRLRGELAEVFLRHYTPDVLIVNHLARGDNNELQNALEGGHVRRGVLTLRGILFDRERTNIKYFQEPNASWIAKHYDAITVHTSAEIFRLEEHYNVPDFLLDRVRYMGYLPDPHPLDRSAARAKLGWDESSRWVVAGMGGGQGAIDIWRSVVGALLASRDEIDRALLVTGPYLEAEAEAELERLTTAEPWIQVLRYHPDVQLLMRASDAFISAAGSNSISEILATAANSILIPRQIREPEQRMHAERVSAHGYARLCDLPEVLAGGLDAVLAQALSDPLRPEVGGLLGGARRYPAFLQEITSTTSAYR